MDRFLNFSLHCMDRGTETPSLVHLSHCCGVTWRGSPAKACLPNSSSQYLHREQGAPARYLHEGTTHSLASMSSSGSFSLHLSFARNTHLNFLQYRDPMELLRWPAGGLWDLVHGLVLFPTHRGPTEDRGRVVVWGRWLHSLKGSHWSLVGAPPVIRRH
jgi:hypothetical protein